MSPIFLGMAAIISGNNLLFLVLSATLALVFVSGLWSDRNLRGLDATVRVIRSPWAGEEALLRVVFRRPQPGRPAYALRVQELDGRQGCLRVDLPRLEGLSHEASGARRFEQRGKTQVRDLEMVTTYPFSLLLKAKELPATVDVWVRPRRVAVPKGLERPPQKRGQGSSRERVGPGSEFYGLRERTEGEENRRLHALATLRRGVDVITETADEVRPSVWVAVANTSSADPEAVERALEIAAALIVAWSDLGYDIGLCLAGVRSPPGTDREVLLDMLAAADVGQSFSPPKNAHVLAPEGCDLVMQDALRIGRSGWEQAA